MWVRCSRLSPHRALPNRQGCNGIRVWRHHNTWTYLLLIETLTAIEFWTYVNIMCKKGAIGVYRICHMSPLTTRGKQNASTGPPLCLSLATLQHSPLSLHYWICISGRSAKNNGHRGPRGKCSSHLPLLCFTAPEKPHFLPGRPVVWNRHINDGIETLLSPRYWQNDTVASLPTAPVAAVLKKCLILWTVPL